MPTDPFIHAALDAIEAGLKAPLTVSDMATAVSVSLYHFSRCFSRATGHGPYDYLMRRRLSAAAGEVLAGEEKIIDIALTYQFNAPESFTRAFRRMFGVAPQEARRAGRLDQRLLLARPDAAYLAFLTRPHLPRREALPDLRLAGLVLPPGLPPVAAWEALATLVAPGAREAFLLTLFPPPPARGVTRLVAVALAAGETVPPALLEKTLPGGTAVLLDLPPEAHAAACGRRYLYQTWWPRAFGPPLPALEIARHGSLRAADTGPALALCLPLPEPAAAP